MQRPLKEQEEEIVPSPLKSDKLADDLEFECCSASQPHPDRPRFRPAEVGETAETGELPRIKNHHSSYSHKPAGHLKSCGSTGPCSIIPISFTRALRTKRCKTVGPSGEAG